MEEGKEGETEYIHCVFPFPCFIRGAPQHDGMLAAHIQSVFPPYLMFFGYALTSSPSNVPPQQTVRNSTAYTLNIMFRRPLYSNCALAQLTRHDSGCLSLPISIFFSTQLYRAFLFSQQSAYSHIWPLDMMFFLYFPFVPLMSYTSAYECQSFGLSEWPKMVWPVVLGGESSSLSSWWLGVGWQSGRLSQDECLGGALQCH